MGTEITEPRGERSSRRVVLRGAGLVAAAGALGVGGHQAVRHLCGTVDPRAVVSLHSSTVAIDEGGDLSSFSNWSSDASVDAVALAAPGGSQRDGRFGILSATSRSHSAYQGSIDDEGRVTVDGASQGVVRDCPDGIDEGDPDPDEKCGLYTWLQGTSMAAPHVSGVAALIISAEGGQMAPDDVVERLRDTASDRACPSGSGDDSGPAGATCTGSKDRNGFFGDGIVDAADAVR